MASGLVTLTMDERQVQVAKGTGMVETAAAAGIEIPVFCYEPRLGPSVGACRMCLVEVEGMPKLQAGCTLTAQDGMVVKTARSSKQAAEGQNSTLEDEPYKGAFSGNVTELCPVGALTSTQYRFEARPWEIQNVPTVCGLCPVGCNISATTREGKVKRILSRNHPEIDEGWLCDKGRFGFTQLYAGDRVRDPLRKIGKRRFEELSWDAALDEAERLLRSGPVLLALSGSETVEQA